MTDRFQYVDDVIDDELEDKERNLFWLAWNMPDEFPLDHPHKVRLLSFLAPNEKPFKVAGVRATYWAIELTPIFTHYRTVPIFTHCVGEKKT